jgi:hypothetical protein
MTTKIKQTLIAGLLGTAAMTLVMFIAPMMGMPKMNAAEMLSMMTSTPMFIGWLMHFMTGVIFASAYAFVFLNILKRFSSNIVKGTIFGMIVFIFAQIVMAMMGAIMGGMPPMEGNIALMMLGSLIGHVIYGIVVASFVKETE